VFRVFFFANDAEHAGANATVIMILAAVDGLVDMHMDL
jgi:hypothetical protein